MADSPHEEILDSFEARLKTLSLDGLESKVYRREAVAAHESIRKGRMQTWALGLVFPCVVVSPSGYEGLADELSDSENEGHSYPIAVRIVDRFDAAQDVTKVGPHLKWRKTIRDAFHRKRLDGAINVVYEPSQVVEQSFFAFDMVSLVLTFSARTSEARTE